MPRGPPVESPAWWPSRTLRVARADSSSRPPERRSGSSLAGRRPGRARRAVAAPLAATRGVDPGAGMQAALGTRRRRRTGGCRRAAVARRVRCRPSTTRTTGLRPPDRADDRHHRLVRGAAWPSRSRSRTRPGRPSRRASCASCAPVGRSTTRRSSRTGSSPTSRERRASRRRTCRSPRAESRSLAAGGATLVSFTVPGEAFADARRVAGGRPRCRDSSSATRWSPRARRRTRTRTCRHPARSRSPSPLRSPRPPGRRPSAHRGRPARELDRPHRAAHAPARRARRAAGGDRHRPAHHRLDPGARHERAGVRRRVAAAPRRRAERGVPARLRRRRPRGAGATRAARAAHSHVVLRRARPRRTSPTARRPRRRGRRSHRPGHRRTDVEPRADARRGADHRGAARMAVHPHRPRLACRRHGRGRQPRLLRRGRAHDRAPRTRQRRARSTAGVGVRDDRRLDRARRRRRAHRAAPRRVRSLDRHRMARGDRASCSPNWPSTPAPRARPCSPPSTAGRTSQTARVSADSIDEIGGSGWSSLAGLSDAIGAPPESTRCSSTSPRPASGAPPSDAWSRRGRGHRVRDRARRSSGCSPGRRAASSCRCSTWPGSTIATRGTQRSSDWLATAARRSPASRSCRAAPSTWSSTETGVPTTIENDLPYPVTVVVDVAPSNGRLIVEERVEVDRRAAVALHRARAGRRGRRQRRGDPRGVADLAHGRAGRQRR